MSEDLREFEKDEDYQFIMEHMEEGYQFKNEKDYQFIKEELKQRRDLVLVHKLREDTRNFLIKDSSDNNIRVLISELGEDNKKNRKLIKRLIKIVKERGYPNFYPKLESKTWKKKYDQFLYDLFCNQVRIFVKRNKLKEILKEKLKNCEDHKHETKKEDLLIVCKHLIKGTVQTYSEYGEGTIFCEECLQIPGDELWEYTDDVIVMCKYCFNDLKEVNNLTEMKVGNA